MSQHCIGSPPFVGYSRYYVHSALYPTRKTALYSRKTVLHGTQEKLYYTSRYTDSFPAVTPLGSNWADCGHNSAPPLLTIIRRSSLRYRYWEGTERMLADRAKETMEFIIITIIIGAAWHEHDHHHHNRHYQRDQYNLCTTPYHYYHDLDHPYLR